MPAVTTPASLLAAPGLFEHFMLPALLIAVAAALARRTLARCGIEMHKHERGAIAWALTG